MLFVVVEVVEEVAKVRAKIYQVGKNSFFYHPLH
jgi:hypothetical protein